MDLFHWYYEVYGIFEQENLPCICWSSLLCLSSPIQQYCQKWVQIDFSIKKEKDLNWSHFKTGKSFYWLFITVGLLRLQNIRGTPIPRKPLVFG